MTEPVEGRAVCRARAAQCRCGKDEGHVEAGDPLHKCPPDRCTGSWTGTYGDPSFNPISLPFPVGTPVPWGTP